MVDLQAQMIIDGLYQLGFASAACDSILFDVLLQHWYRQLG